MKRSLDPGRSSAAVAVLTYHSIAPDPPPSLAAITVDPALFAEQMTALRELGIAVIRFAEVPDALAAGCPAVAITIDDGFADAAEHACPTLKDLGMPATLFVPTGWIGGGESGRVHDSAGQPPPLSWEEITSLDREGFEIGSHGCRHLAADVHSPALVERDARASRHELEDHLGHPVDSFAYPFGYHSAAARRAVRAAGYRQACILSDLPARAGDDRWALPRFQVSRRTSPEALLSQVSARSGPGARAWTRSKQRIWHLGRRWAGWGPAEARRMPE